MSVCGQDHRGITLAVAVALGRLNQLGDLRRPRGLPSVIHRFERPSRLIFSPPACIAVARCHSTISTGRRGDGKPGKPMQRANFRWLPLALARRWPNVLSNAVDPGWVRTKMGGTGAPGDLDTGQHTQSWLATSEEPAAKVSGGYWHHQRQEKPAREAAEPVFQDQLIARLEDLTGIALPAAAPRPNRAKHKGLR
jgi:hypothetical protein